tara:strand:+ start:31210 stop:31437 length:228 start_codon:yes stop_codon:yes gene_type:complete
MADIKVRVGQQNATRVVSSLAGNVSGSLAGLSDTDILNPQNGMVLVFNSSTQKFEATLQLTPGTVQNLDINGGNF